jgi:hypothetical protein
MDPPEPVPALGQAVNGSASEAVARVQFCGTSGKFGMMSDPIQLIDLRQRNDLTPPSYAAVLRLTMGDGVELGIGSVRFVAEILQRYKGVFVGRVIETNPILPVGTEVTFSVDNILDVFCYRTR